MKLDDYMFAVKRADALTKANNGHSFIIMLKTRCQYCHRSPKQKGVCPRWFDTFIGHLGRELTGTRPL